MSKTVKIEVENQDALAALQGFFKSVLGLKDIDGLLVSQHLPMKNVVMPTLSTDAEQLEKADPLAPSFPLNAAKLASRLTRKSFGGKIAVVLRSCEIRAFVELVKLKQGQTDDVVIIGIDCLGAYNNKDYKRFIGEDALEATRTFYRSVLSGKGAASDGIDLAPACRVCEKPVPENADIALGLYGVDTDNQLLVQSRTEKGDAILGELGLAAGEEPSARKEVLEVLVAERSASRDQMFAATSEATSDIEKLTNYLANCVNCYNCRVACPVCYCKECVFLTDVFDHEPLQYLKWAGRKGGIKMPTDTTFFHLTRIAHMSLACVGCGQCSNACPNDIPLTELFRTLADTTQASFDYSAGRSLDEEPPLALFEEDEYQEVVGVFPK
ncbi:MAG: formate dehydrogenase [Proteobacteria bacterium]|nr:formate dehydrogenase [Pseudomonadota bacterium]